PTDLPTPLPTAVPTTPPVKSMGSVWIFPESQTVAIDTQFITEVRCHTGTTRIAAYGIDIYYNPQIVAIYRDIGNNGVQPGSDGFLSAINANESGKLVTSGFDTDGSGPGENLHILTVNWTAIAMGTTYIEINIRNLVNENTYTIGELQGIPGKVTVM
ncbi:MAG: hypothetical protein JW881_01620, partial [Spirochaetales bacterium]|nr:hypothetical protein [Spirochaetales bacterium]